MEPRSGETIERGLTGIQAAKVPLEGRPVSDREEESTSRSARRSRAESLLKSYLTQTFERPEKSSKKNLCFSRRSWKGDKTYHFCDGVASSQNLPPRHRSGPIQDEHHVSGGLYPAVSSPLRRDQGQLPRALLWFVASIIRHYKRCRHFVKGAVVYDGEAQNEVSV